MSAGADQTPPLEYTAAPISSWERLYRFLEAGQIPWNAGKPDRDLVRLVESGAIAPGKTLDVGTGLGHDAVFLARKGFPVVTVDISPTAVKLAKAAAAEAQVEEAIEFRTEDALRMSLPAGGLSFVNDRGFFHYLKPDERSPYVALVHQALAPAGLLLLRTFCDAEPPGFGPARYKKAELEELFTKSFEPLEFKESVFEGATKAKSFLCLLRKR
ncbi:MAG: methyltransferase domain-containing protein [Elusimicrobia bacterium]|nr:methyltransferase domain-containing protein [Elusimicrobiota bacterium]